MEHTQIIVTGGITSIESAVDAAFLWEEVQRLKATARRMESELETELHRFMCEENITSIELDENRKIIRCKKQKNRFGTKAIYEALAFTDAQKLILPSNPAFRKTEVLANPATAPAFYEEEFDEIELKEFNKKFIKK